VTRRLLIYGSVALCVAGLAIWGGTGSSGASAAPQVLDVYSSMPLRGYAQGPAVAIVNGIKLALKQAVGRAGPWTIHYVSLDDSTALTGTWAPVQCRERTQGGLRPKRRLLHRRVQLGVQRSLDPDPEPGKHPTGQPRQQLHSADGARAWDRPW
jgi:hypothetical protein